MGREKLRCLVELQLDTVVLTVAACCPRAANAHTCCMWICSTAAAGNHEKDATGTASVAGNNAVSGGECGVPYTYR
jgi:hypothetical protein